MDRTTMEIDKSTLGKLKQVGKKSETYDDLIRHRFKCSTRDCEGIGSIEIGIHEANSGNITLFVCPKCVGRFGDRYEN